MSVHRGQIVMVDFPYADRTGSRVRPALVVQADDLNAALNATVPAMITSSRSRMVGHPCQYLIDSAHLDYPSLGSADGQLDSMQHPVHPGTEAGSASNWLALCRKHA